jgi:hypothetical protein
MGWQYKVLNSKKVEDVEKYANDQDSQGWELYLISASQDRYVSVYRKPKS